MGQKTKKSHRRSTPRWYSELVKWADRAASDELAVSPQVANAAKRFIRWLDAKKYEFRASEIERTLDLFGMLQHVRGRHAGHPFALAPWQLFVVANLFGWWDDTRRVTRRAFISLARKNGKSTLAAGLALKALFADREAGPQVVCVATSRDQARIVFGEASAMMEGDSQLRRLGYVYRSELRCPGNRGRLWAAGADSARMWGYSLSCAIVDELHAHKDRRLWDAIATSMVARQNPLLIAISTAGDDEAMLFDELRTVAHSISEEADELDAYFAFDCYVPDEDEWKDPAVWAKANPSLGVTLSLDDLATVFSQSRTPSAEAAFRRYHLNQQLAGASQWLPLEMWRQSEVTALPNLDERSCVVGVDLGSTRDLSAIVAIFPDGDRYYCKHWAFSSAYAVERSQRAKLYQRFAAAGDLIVTPGDVIDEQIVRTTLLEITKRYDVQAIYYDRALAAPLVQRLIRDGVPESLLVAHPMHAKAMDAPIRETEIMICDRKLLHERSEVFEYCISNCVVETNSYGHKRLSKRRSTGPIDLVVALVLAAGNATLRQEAEAIGIQWL